MAFEPSLQEFARESVQRWSSPTTRDTSAKSRSQLAGSTRHVMSYRETLNYPHDEDRAAIPLCLFAWGGPASHSVILAHGWELQAGRMTPLVRPLLAAGFRVIAVDAPAHGESGGAELNLPNYARAIRAACDWAGGDVSILAHSFGGTAALWLAAFEPPPTLQSVVTMGAGSGAAYLSTHILRHLDEAHRRAWVAEFVRRFGMPPSSYNIEAFGSRISVPVLIAHDSNDNVVSPSQADLIAAHVCSVRRIATDGFGHVAMLRSPQLATRIVEFLADC